MTTRHTAANNRHAFFIADQEPYRWALEWTFGNDKASLRSRQAEPQRESDPAVCLSASLGFFPHLLRWRLIGRGLILRRRVGNGLPAFAPMNCLAQEVFDLAVDAPQFVLRPGFQISPERRIDAQQK